MTILVFGTTGQLAQEIARLRAGIGSRPPVLALGRGDVDLARPEQIRHAINHHHPALVVNAAAYTAVDRAEAEPDLAFAVNRDAPAAMAEACAAIGVPLVHVSTDYVFDGGKPGAYDEDDAISPLSVYGRSKAEGEDAIRQRLASHVILRTSWVFSAHGQNFVKTMLRLGATRDEITVVDDQKGGPTPAAALAGAVMTVAARLLEGGTAFGTYHFQGAPAATWREFAEAIFALGKQQDGRGVKVTPITTAQYPTPATRPMNGTLDCRRIKAAFGLSQPDWRSGLEAVVAQLFSQPS